MRRDGSNLRVMVLHGAHGGPDTNWFPWLRSELSAQGIEAIVPRFPTPEGQSLQAWFDAYDRATNALPAVPTMIVGHSLGAAFALRLVERADKPFEGLLLASGFVGALDLPDYDPINASFFVAPLDWTGIRKRKGRTCRCWAGDDDPYVPLPRSQDVADHLHAPLEVIRQGGHLNSETGFNTFPHLRDAILTHRTTALAG